LLLREHILVTCKDKAVEIEGLELFVAHGLPY
jgi:hypothetical protein